MVAIKPITADEIRRNPYGCLELALDKRGSDNRGVQDEVLSKYIFIKGMELVTGEATEQRCGQGRRLVEEFIEDCRYLRRGLQG